MKIKNLILCVWILAISAESQTMSTYENALESFKFSINSDRMASIAAVSLAAYLGYKAYKAKKRIGELAHSSIPYFDYILSYHDNQAAQLTAAEPYNPNWRVYYRTNMQRLYELFCPSLNDAIELIRLQKEKDGSFNIAVFLLLFTAINEWCIRFSAIRNSRFNDYQISWDH